MRPPKTSVASGLVPDGCQTDIRRAALPSRRMEKSVALEDALLKEVPKEKFNKGTVRIYTLLPAQGVAQTWAH